MSQKTLIFGYYLLEHGPYFEEKMMFLDEFYLKSFRLDQYIAK